MPHFYLPVWSSKSFLSLMTLSTFVTSRSQFYFKINKVNYIWIFWTWTTLSINSRDAKLQNAIKPQEAIFKEISCFNCNALRKSGRGGGRYLTKFYTGRLRPRGPTLPFHMPFWLKRYPFYIPFIDKRYPSHIPTLGSLVLIYT